MATNVVVTDGTCASSLPNGTNGQELTLVGGVPTWVTPITGVSTDAGQIAVLGSDSNVLVTCESVQDCVGTAITAGSGLFYDDALNAIYFQPSNLNTYVGPPTNAFLMTAANPNGAIAPLADLADALCATIRTDCFTGGVGVDINTATGDITFDATELTAAAACAVPATIVGGDNLRYSWTDNAPLKTTVTVTIPFFLLANPPAAAVITDVPGFVPSILRITNTHPCKNMQVFFWGEFAMDNFSGVTNGNSWVSFMTPATSLNGAAFVNKFSTQWNANAATNGGVNWDGFNGTNTNFLDAGFILAPGDFVDWRVTYQYFTTIFLANPLNALRYNFARWGLIGLAI